MKQAIALCRVSTKGQLDDGNLEPQKERIEIAAKYLDVKIVRLWEVAISSRKGKNILRKDLLEMFDFCKKNRSVKYLIVDEPDRFMRSIGEFYWWKQEFTNMHVQLRYADRPEADPNDDKFVFEELIDVYRAESSNNERIHKTPEKQMSKMRAGYYTFAPLPGYRKSTTPSLHEVDPDRFYLLQKAFKAVASHRLTVDEALKEMTRSGYRTVNNQQIDMARFKDLLKRPFYAGIIQVADWPVATNNGLHEHMITIEEHETIKFILSGKKKKFVVNKKNPDFPLNEMACYECTEEANARGKLTGYRNHNGKTKDKTKRQYYFRYRCRGCKNYFTRDELHKMVSVKLDEISKHPIDQDNLVKSLEKAWKNEVEDKTNRITALQNRRQVLESEQTKLALSLANSSSNAVTVATQRAIEVKDEDIKKLDVAIKKLSEDEELDKFISFAIARTEKLRVDYWKLSWADRKRCEQLLFPDGLYVTRSKKVYTPTVSIVYRGNKKAQELSLALVHFKNSDGGPTGTRTQDTLLKRQVL